MALTAAQRLALRATYGATLSDRREAFNISKANLDATITAIDNWIEANATAYNNAIPQPARSALTAAQKAELLYLIALRRYGG
jgi:hypothetical protein